MRMNLTCAALRPEEARARLWKTPKETSSNRFERRSPKRVHRLIIASLETQPGEGVRCLMRNRGTLLHLMSTTLSPRLLLQAKTMSPHLRLLQRPQRRSPVKSTARMPASSRLQEEAQTETSRNRRRSCSVSKKQPREKTCVTAQAED